MRLQCFVLFLLLSLPAALLAQTCARPEPFDRTSEIAGAVAFVEGSDPAVCDLATSVGAAGLIPSGAFAWYSMPGPRTTFRISFRVDTSLLAEDSVVDGVEILAVTSRHPAPAPYGNVLLHVGLVGSGEDPTSPYVSYLAYCNSCSGQSAVGFFPLIVSGDQLGFEIGIGAGADGWLRYWHNASFSDPPTFSQENLDNGALLGGTDVALGAFNVASSLAAVGTALRFSDIQTSDDVIFWSDFDE
jgi:hypothetical protein